MKAVITVYCDKNIPFLWDYVKFILLLLSRIVEALQYVVWLIQYDFWQ